ncbi:1-phosphatidylinositol 3-phosphate 5-kinase-like isoform X3 [Physella acuta]|uniref:1-phosphatidylinositol 3-phosphate 5-kinase-like isoform X3 n=1 Tax=Physella acuta TaxID=109671 RepID=UPI0027DC5415|nr:1-phosphatidylinositol 3-phosphate 5-kinase-like isoform X3 [Physella acuta]
MSSASGHKRKLWEELPNTFTEFGPLSSDVKQSGGFFSRLWKKNKDDAGQSVTSSNSTLNEDSGQDEDKLSTASGVVSKANTPPSSVRESRRNSGSSDLVDGDAISITSGKFDQSEEASKSIENRVPHRNLSSVLSRLGSIIDHRSTTPQTYKDSDFKQYWMPDSSCRECYDCGDKFTIFLRRHHCRICGQIFCSKCCNQELPGKIIGYKGGIRVCTYCCRVVQKYAQQSASTGDFSSLDLRAISQMYRDSTGYDFGSRSLSPRLTTGLDDMTPPLRGDSHPDLPGLIGADMSTPFDLTPQSEFSSEESLLLESRLLIQDSVQLREIWRQICDAEVGVETQTLRIRLRTHQNCIVGKELVDWLIKKDKAATRDQAIAIGQALLFARYLDSVGNHHLMFKDDFTLYRHGETASSFEMMGDPESMPTIREELEKNEPLWFQEIGKSNEDSEESSSPRPEGHRSSLESDPLKSNSSESESKTVFYIDTSHGESSHSGSFSEIPKGVLMSRDMVEEPLPRQDSSVHGLGDDFLKGALFLGKTPMASPDESTCPHGWRSVEQLREENGERLAYDRLKKAHTELWRVLTRQLLGQHSLLLSWESVVSTSITQVSHFVRPDIKFEGDDMDIRNYIHIKKVAGGSKSETSLFHGVIFTKNIAHKKMKTNLMNPLILLLRGTIEFQRVENKFSSLEPQILQEREFMRNCVMKMVAYRPNVVVVEKSVSRLAQEFLLEAGITLLYNVKPSVMERLARFTQADIVPSIDGLVSKPKMGFCHDFRVQTYNLPNKETKTLAIFDGCATHLGCTIVLRGGTQSELRKVKHVLKFMSYTAYNSLLELGFCMDEFALPQPGADEIGQPFEGLDTSQDVTTYGIRSEDVSKKTQALEDVDAEDVVDRKCFDARSVDSISLEDISEAADMYQVGYRQGEKTQVRLNGEEGELDLNLDPTSEAKGACLSVETSGVQSNKVVESSGSQAVQGSHPQVVKADGQGTHGVELAGLNFQVIADTPVSHVKGYPDTAPALTTQVQAANVPEYTQANLCADIMSAELNLPDEDYFRANTDPIDESNRPNSATGSSDFLSVSSSQREKSRHPSGVSSVCCTEGPSGRSTPEYVFKSNLSDDGSWDGAPKVIANIMCVIPKSAVVKLPSDSAAQVDAKPRRTSDADHQRDLSRQAKLDSSSSDLLTHNLDPDVMESGDAGKENKDKNEKKTSKLTELTDCSDPLQLYQNTQDESVFHSTNPHKMALKEIKQTKYKTFRKALDGVHLSVSPYHKYSVPFIETDKGSRCAVRKYLPDEIFWSSLFDGEAGQRLSKTKLVDVDVSSKALNKSNIQMLQPHNLINCNLTEPIWENNIQKVLADFRARGGCIQVVNGHTGRQSQPEVTSKKGEDTLNDSLNFGTFWEKKTDCLDPMNHQRLLVLFSSYSYKSANHPYPCVYPWIVNMEFYGRNDITLGGFLERFCFRPQYSCPSPTCDSPMTDHVRRFVHGNACINLLLKKLDNEVPGGKENIFMWSWCKKCKQVTPVVPISHDTWSLSFAKYLDLRFHSSSFYRRGSAEPCLHSLHHDHFQYFGHRNIVASFKFATISLKELSLPPATLTIRPPTFDVIGLGETVKTVTCRAMERYSLMLENTMKVKQDYPEAPVNDMLAEQQTDKRTFRDSATNIQLKIQELVNCVTSSAPTGPTDCDMSFHLYSIFDNIELLKRKITEDVVKWNTKMQELLSSQQKKNKAQTTKKDRESGNLADELEKSMKLSDRSLTKSLPVVPPATPPVVQRTTSVSGETVNPAVDDGAGPEVIKPSQLPVDSAEVMSTLLLSVGSGSAQPEALDDNTDGWFQDLKGVTRRWLSTTSFVPVPLPFEASEHHTLPMCERVPIVIYDNEPSSIIAYALSSSDYLCCLRELHKKSHISEAVGSQSNKTSTKPADSGNVPFMTSDLTPEQDEVNISVLSDDATPSPEEKVSTASPHIELQFSDSSAKFYCRVYFADQFRKLRKHLFLGNDNLFIRSLSRCKTWEAKGGKSGSSFCKTDDDRFILKQMSNMEVESFEKFGPQYFQYMRSCITDQQPTALAKIVGVYRIGFRNTQTNNALRQDVLVMENLFYNRKISQKFDLKGSLRNRLVNINSKREEELVLLDENLLKCSVESPLYLRPHSKYVLKSAITSDSLFLSTNLVMDYSLLVGVDESTQEMVVGIIDYIRTFTWDKKLEMVVKSSGILGGQGKMPTVVSPQLYRGRFLEAMDRYFLQVPDHWTGLGQDSCSKPPTVEPSTGKDPKK